MNNYFKLIFAVFLFVLTSSFQTELSKGSIKKMDKTIAALWPNQEVIKQQLIFNKVQLEKLSFKPVNPYYRITQNDNTIAYICVSNAKSKIMTFDYMVVLDTDLTIKAVKMLAYREEYGGEIGSKRWLSQFNGKNKPEHLNFGHDIQGISGATISARNITYDIQKVMSQIIELKKEGAL